MREISLLGLWMWRKILKYRELVKSFFKMEVYNGELNLFWYDHWSPMERLIDITYERGFCSGVGSSNSS